MGNTMRFGTIPLIVAIGLSACGPAATVEAPTGVPTEAPTEAPEPTVPSPNPFQTPYRAEGWYGLLFNGQMTRYEVVLRHSGRKFRVERPVGVELFDYDTLQATVVGGRTQPIQDIDDIIYHLTGELYRNALEAGELVPGVDRGVCEHIGESGRLLEYPWGDRVCLTSDGIPLQRTDSNGRAFWEITKLERGDQPARLFQGQPG